jgi:hypothetical protein
MSETIKKWLKSKSNFAFLLIIILSVCVNLYYFSKTSQQALWWDEADYMAYAKNLAGLPVNWVVTAKHNSLYPFIAALFFKLGASELLVKFFLQFLPTVGTVILSGLLARKMYQDNRVSVIVSFIIACLWTLLFNASRFHVDTLALFFGITSIFVFWQGYEKQEKIFRRFDKKWAIPLTILFVVLTYAVRRGYIIFGAFFAIYIFSTRKIHHLLKDKYNWIGLTIAIALFLFVESWIFSSGLGSISGEYYHQENQINFLPLQVFGAFFNNPYSSALSILTYLFWIGLISTIVKLSLSFGHINSSEESKSDLFNIISIAVTLALFIFILRTPGTFGEARWYLPLALSSCILIAKPSMFIAKFLESKKKNLGIFVVAILIVYGGYYELKYNHDLIEQKLTSFDAIHKTGELIKESSSPNEKILGLPAPQLAFYSERSVYRPRDLLGINDTNNVPFDPVLEKIKSDPDLRYIVISFSEPNHPDWMRNNDANIQQTGIMSIPFTNTTINLQTGKQEIKQEVYYGKVSFKLVKIEQEVFIYEINHISA